MCYAHRHDTSQVLVNLFWRSPLDADFLTWAGWLLPYDRPLGLIGSAAAVQAAQPALALIGLDAVASAWSPEVLATDTAVGYTRRPASEVHPRWTQNGLVVLDVRTAEEYAAGHIPGSRHIPLGHLPGRLDEVPIDQPVLVHCAGGTRSPIAASLLLRRVTAPILEMQDGFDAWCRAGYPVTR